MSTGLELRATLMKIYLCTKKLIGMVIIGRNLKISVYKKKKIDNAQQKREQ